MKPLVFLAVLLLTGSAWAQTAKVIALTPEDADKAKALYAERDRVNAEISKLQDHVYKTYLSGDKESGNILWGVDGKHFNVKPGWFAGFEFSEDFRYIVPSAAPLLVGGSIQYYPACWNTPTGSTSFVNPGSN